MNWFKEKCSHLYEEIGKYYDRIDYGNGTHINAYIVKNAKYAEILQPRLYIQMNLQRIHLL
nr:MAG TPA: hypothetical protein [Caudoviricetes sp.]